MSSQDSSNFLSKSIIPTKVILMKILYFSTLSADSAKTLDDLIKSHVPNDALETYRDMANFKERLNQPIDNISVALIAVDNNTLKKLQTLEKQLKKLRLVVILPTKDKETVALGNKLHPRFLSYTFGNFSVVKTVLKKYFSNAHPTVLPQPPKDNQSLHQNCSCKEKNNLASNFQGDLLKLI